MWQSVVWIWLSGLLFAIIHSLTASQMMKQWAYAKGLQEPYYRLIYSIFSLFTTGLWIGFVHHLADMPLYHMQGVWHGLFVAIQMLGVAIALAAFIPIDGAVFLGLKKAKGNTDPFIVRGVYQYVRHPMYSGAMLILLADASQSVNGLNLALVASVYFVVGARFEERRMLAEHADYADYQKSVPAFIPKLRR